MRNAFRILVGNRDKNRQLGRPGHRYRNNIKMDLGEIEWEGVN